MARTKVEWVPDEAAIKEFAGWTGPVGQSVNRLAMEAVFRIRGLANRRSGVMTAGMHYKKGTWSRGIQFDAGSDVGYTLFVDQGTKPHPIKPKNPGGVLTFYWPKVGRVVHFKSVQHPGNKPYKFLERGLEAALSMWERGG
ncbi:hypothetical protein [Longimicrobium sp.]|jgi:hypothetical protein|uniref:hypothetical protein n=1 Tax=Longimicrobium sp. TaxID=2029185 RepID=UPI002ED7B164